MIKYTLFDYYDKQKINPLMWYFDHQLIRGETFEANDVTYRVFRRFRYLGKRAAFVKMVRYKIPDKSTQFVHKCPAHKSKVDSLSHGDIIKLEKKLGGKKVKALQTGRVKMRSYNALEFKCEHCKVVFFKKHNTIPDTVQVDKVMKKKGLKKRK